MLLHADIRPPCSQDLRELGAAALGPRRRLMAAAAILSMQGSRVYGFIELLHADMSPCCQDLRELGVIALGPRRRLMAAAAAGAAAASAAMQRAERCPRSACGSSVQGRCAPEGAGAEKMHPVMAAARRSAGAAPSPARCASQECQIAHDTQPQGLLQQWDKWNAMTLLC